MKQVLLDELVSIWELLFLSSILNPFATKLSMFVFLVISWRCQCFLLWGAPFFVFYSFTSPACETRNTFFQSFTDRFFVVVLFRASGRMIRTAKKRNREGECTHTHRYERISSHPYIVQSVVNICFTTLFALGWNLQPFFMRQTDVAELSLEMGLELFSDGFVYLFSAAFWRGFSESYFVSRPTNIWWASARLHLPPSFALRRSLFLSLYRRGKSNCREMHMEYLRSRSGIIDRVQLGRLLMVAQQFDNAQSPHSLIELTWQWRGEGLLS